VEACTVTALDAITAFAVPNPNFSSQSRRFFQVRMPVELPLRANHSAYFGLAKFYFKPTLSAVDASHPKQFLQSCQCRFSVQNNTQNKLEIQPIGGSNSSVPEARVFDVRFWLRKSV